MTIEPCEDTLRKLRTAADPLAAFQMLLSGQGGIGFFYLLSILPPHEDGARFSRNAFVHHTFPMGWDSAQGRDTLFDHDPTLARLSPTRDEVAWHALPDAPTLSAAQRRWLSTSGALGLCCGVTLRLSDAKDRHSFAAIGLWLGREGTEQSSDDLWSRRGTTLRRMSAALDRVLRGGRGHSLIPLSPREAECLSRLAKGGSPTAISQTLGISTKTFEKHIASAKLKLKARSRDHAVAKALLLNLVA